jgi:bifunctional UDP-N-acetylglucosamine pyrophosphorylase / glucosamine-1-phosphate N-acetyltransferase
MEINMSISSVILAAGHGTRMKSAVSKVLHPVCGRPLIWHSLTAAARATGSTPIVIIGHAGEAVQKAVGEAAVCVTQERQLGTGHAVLQASAVLKGKSDLVLVTYADMPLLTEETLSSLIQEHRANSSVMTMLTIFEDDPRGFGRIIRNENGSVQAIVEEAQATPEQLMIKELNASVYCFNAGWLWEALERITLSPKGEYYLTDLVEIGRGEGLEVSAIVLEDSREAIGINNRVHLAEAEKILKSRINEHWMLEGVTLIDPSSTYIEPGVSIGRDTVIWPNTYLRGSTRIGENCTIGPNTIIDDTTVGSGCTILSSVLEKALLEDDVEMGPFARLRKGAHLAKGVHMGNFGEIKNSYLGPGTKMGHFSYLGDATIGEDVNIGAGTITCNYDGAKKHTTEIGRGAFIGSDTMLVAPLKIGEGARTGAGAVVTKNIADYHLAVGMPARSIKKLEKSD